MVFPLEKVCFFLPSNYGRSLVLALKLQNQTPAVYQLCKPDRNAPRAGATTVSARSTRDDRGIGPFSFSRGPLTPALSSLSYVRSPTPNPNSRRRRRRRRRVLERMRTTIQEEMFAMVSISKLKRAKAIVMQKVLDATKG